MINRLIATLPLICLVSFLSAQGVPDPVVVPGKSSWPAASLPAGFPEYKAGKVANYGNGGEADWLLIYCVDDSKEHLEAYIASFKASGWEIGFDGMNRTASKDRYLVTFGFHPKSKLVSIELRTLSTAKDWPTKLFPALPVFSACRSSSYRVNEYDTTVDLRGVKDAGAMDAYRKLLEERGWTGGPDEYSWAKGKPELSLQLNDQGDGTWYFSVSAAE
jgi:hypothetical protein